MLSLNAQLPDPVVLLASNNAHDTTACVSLVCGRYRVLMPHHAATTWRTFDPQSRQWTTPRTYEIAVTEISSLMSPEYKEYIAVLSLLFYINS